MERPRSGTERTPCCRRAHRPQRADHITSRIGHKPRRTVLAAYFRTADLSRNRRLIPRGTGSSNSAPSSRESTNFWFRASAAGRGRWIRTPGPGLRGRRFRRTTEGAGAFERTVCGWDREFESAFLQRGGRCKPNFGGAPIFAGSASRLEPLAPFPLASPVRFSRSVQEPG